MEKKSNALLSQSLMYGLFYALVGIIISILFWMFNFIPTSTGAGILIFIITLVVNLFLLYYFTRKYRDDVMGGFISYGQAFLFAFLVVVVSALITAVYNYVFNAFIDPDYMSRVMKVTSESMEHRFADRGLSQEQIDQFLARMESRMDRTPLSTALRAIPGSVIFGTIVALITSAIVKKEEVIPGDN